MKLQSIEILITKSVAIIFLIAIVLGLAYQPAALAVHSSMSYVLIVVMFLQFLKIDPNAVKSELNKWGYHAWVILLELLILPILFFYLVYCFSLFIPGVSPQFKIGMLLFFATATAATAGPLVSIFGGNFNRTMLNLILSSILMIGTLPLLFVMLGQGGNNIPYLNLFYFMLELIVAPLVVAVFCRLLLPSFCKIMQPHIGALSVLLLAVVILGCVMGLDVFFLDSYRYVIAAVVLSSFCLFLSYFMGWLGAIKPGKEDRLTIAIISPLRNIGLTVVLADHLFRQTNPLVVLIVSLTVVPFVLMAFPIKYFSKRLGLRPTH